MLASRHYVKTDRPSHDGSCSFIISIQVIFTYLHAPFLAAFAKLPTDNLFTCWIRRFRGGMITAVNNLNTGTMPYPLDDFPSLTDRLGTRGNTDVLTAITFGESFPCLDRTLEPIVKEKRLFLQGPVLFCSLLIVASWRTLQFFNSRTSSFRARKTKASYADFDRRSAVFPRVCLDCPTSNLTMIVWFMEPRVKYAFC